MDQENKPDAYAALRIPDYRWFLAMRMMTTFTVQIMSVAVQYYVYELTNSPLMLGLIGLAEAVPAIGISLWAGHLADKYNRRNILIGCLSLLLLCSLALCGLVLYKDTLPVSTLLIAVYG
ncbi:MAG: MFS transporter, partial [Saprospiraceae bacterium]